MDEVIDDVGISSYDGDVEQGENFFLTKFNDFETGMEIFRNKSMILWNLIHRSELDPSISLLTLDSYFDKYLVNDLVIEDW